MGSFTTNIARTQVNCQNTSQNISEPSGKEDVLMDPFTKSLSAFRFFENFFAITLL